MDEGNDLEYNNDNAVDRSKCCNRRCSVKKLIVTLVSLAVVVVVVASSSSLSMWTAARYLKVSTRLVEAEAEDELENGGRIQLMPAYFNFQ